MKEALKLTSYANRPPCTSILQCDRIIRKGNQTIKVTSQLTDRNHIKMTKVRDTKGRGHVEPIPLAMV